MIKNLQPTTYPPTIARMSLLRRCGRGHLQPKAGFVMLFSVLISSLLVVVGLSIFNITLKELTISTAARESQLAFYAANAGLECALYWDLQKGAFASNDTSAVSLAQCGSNISINSSNIISSGPKFATTEFQFKIINPNASNPNPPCADVKVIKKTIIDPLSGLDTLNTTIESQGTNTCDEGRRVQRGLRATY